MQPKSESADVAESSIDPAASAPIAELKEIVKHFPGVTALDRVDFDVHPGEVHVLFGENGSGKSTLVNIIAGTYPRDSGEFYYQGQKVSHLTPQQARAAGISPVFQEFSLVPDMTVEENLFLGRERTSAGLLRKVEMRSTGREVLSDLGFHIDPSARVRTLVRADQQMTEIAKALLQNVKLLILDEPTASLTERETAKLFDIINRLKSRGVGIIYVSHRMAEIREVGDRVTVLRDGKRVATVKTNEVTDKDLVEMMTGRTIDMLFPHVDQKPRANVLEVRNLTVDGRLHDVSIYLRAGEITGVAGLAGGGKSAIARAIFGLEKIASGEIVHGGERIHQPKPAMMLARGLFYFPSDRAAEGLALPRPVRENATMASLDLSTFAYHKLLRRRNERIEVSRMVERLKIRPPNIERAVAFLSGGNRQKVMLLRGLTRETKVFLFDDPTVGIDVGAKKDVYDFLKELAEGGAAVLFISSELPELLNLSNRLYVMHRGRRVAEFRGDEITEQNVLASFFERDTTPITPRPRHPIPHRGD
jgi:ribose transport system ATP-binding protein